MALKIAVIGGGIVGLATGHQLLRRFPRAQLVLLEKEAGPGRHQSGNNSGVLHCGLYYAPGSKKARLAVQGIRRMVNFCAEHGIPHEICGKVVVATRDEEVPRLHALLQRGQANGLEGLELLGPQQLREIEPHAAGLAAIRVPQEGIVDYKEVTRVMSEEIMSRGGDVFFSAKVLELRQGPGWTLDTTAGEFQADFIINCTGLHSDRVSKLAGNKDEAKIVPFRGEYYKIKPDRQYLVNHLIYPVPDPSFPFLGVHFTRLIHGGIEAGPNAVLAFAREGYKKTDVSPRDLIESLTYKGFWRFLLRYPSVCWNEFRQSFSKELFCRALRRLVPEIQIEDLAPGGAGVRAQALSPRGELLQDFYFVRQPNALHVLNAPSPGATASLAIADEIIDLAQEGFTG